MSNQQLIPIVFPLIGVFIGGLISYLSTSAMESRRWRREKLARLAQDQREAIAKALQWVDPMQLSVDRAGTLVSSVLQFVIEEDAFLERFPRLGSEMAKLDLSLNIRLLLPDDLYRQGMIIVQSLENIQIEGIRWSQRARMEAKPMLGFIECREALDKVQKQIDSLREDLSRAYKATYA